MIPMHHHHVYAFDASSPCDDDNICDNGNQVTINMLILNILMISVHHHSADADHI
jgi:hypothetical protein